MVAGALLAAAVLQVKGEQAGKAGAASASCQQGGNRLLEDVHGAACGDQASTGLERARGIHVCPRAHGHLAKQEPLYCHSRSESRQFPPPKFHEKPRFSR